MNSEHELIQALKSCRADNRIDYACRQMSISKFGVNGLATAFSVNTTYHYNKPGPSWTTIEKAMNLIFKALGKALGEVFKNYTKAFQIYYKPHFKMMKMLDQTIERYWEGLDFMDWVLDVIQELEQSVRTYVHLTGNHSIRDSFLYINKFKGKEMEAAIEEVFSTAAVISEFDKMLLNDIEELFTALNDGMDQLIKLEPAKTVIDQVALNKLHTEASIFIITSQSEVFKMIESLVEHRNSWAVKESFMMSSSVLNNKFHKLVDKIEYVEKAIGQKMGGGR